MNIPDDILLNIFDFVETASVEALFASLTCPRWYRLCKESFGNYFNTVSPTSVVQRRDMMEIIEGPSKMMKRHPLPLNLFVDCVTFGSLENLQLLRGRMNLKIDDHFLNIVALRGDLEMMKWLLEQGCVPSMYTLANAIKIGSLEIMEWLLSVGCKSGYVILRSALESNNPRQMLEWIERKNIPRNGPFLNIALESCSLDFIKWLIEVKNIPISNDIIHNMAKCSVEMLEYFFVMGYSPSVRSSHFALHEGNFDAVRWMMRKGLPISMDVTNLCAARGDLKMLVELVAHGCVLTARTFNAGLHKGDIPILEWLLKNDCPFNDEIMIYASMAGIELMEWLSSKNLPMSPVAAESIITFNNHSVVEKLDWLLSHGLLLNLDQKAGNTAATYGYIDVLEWLKARVQLDCVQLLFKAFHSNRFKPFKWVLDNYKCDENPVNLLCHKSLNLDIYDWLLSNGMCSLVEKPETTWK